MFWFVVAHAVLGNAVLLLAIFFHQPEEVLASIPGPHLHRIYDRREEALPDGRRSGGDAYEGLGSKPEEVRDASAATVHSVFFSKTLFDFKKSISGLIELKFSGKTPNEVLL